jgi:hypothetical protein
VTAFGALVTLWCLADSHADAEGVLTGYTADDIDAHVGVPGFCNALPADWIDSSGEFVKLPEYQEHNGTTGKTRAQDSKRQKRHREAAGESRENRDKKRTRGEERREEEKKEEAPEVAIPLDDGTDHLVYPADLNEFRSAYPRIDPLGECRKARAWCLSNAANRKTRRGVGKFLNGWMARAQKDAEAKPQSHADKPGGGRRAL